MTHTPDVIFRHFEKLHAELKDEIQLWSDCEDYLFSFLHRASFQAFWETNQSDYDPDFQTCVNKGLNASVATSITSTLEGERG